MTDHTRDPGQRPATHYPTAAEHVRRARAHVSDAFGTLFDVRLVAGTDVLNVAWQLLDRTPKGRDAGDLDGWPRRKDEY